MLLALAVAAVQPSAAETTEAAARTTVARYYSLIEHGRYRAAYRLWGDAGARSGKSYAAFVRGFAGTAHTRVATRRPTDTGAAAGSAYVTVPVTVFAIRRDGSRQRFRGAYVMRRVNGIDGATAAQLRWHIDSAKLRPF